MVNYQAELKKQEDKTRGFQANQNLESLESRPREDDEKTARQILESLKSRLREAIIDQGARVRKLEGKPEHEDAVRRLETLKADYKAATGSDWSEVRAEGPILLTTNSVRGREILPELSERLRELITANIIRYNI